MGLEDIAAVEDGRGCGVDCRVAEQQCFYGLLLKDITSVISRPELLPVAISFDLNILCSQDEAVDHVPDLGW